MRRIPGKTANGTTKIPSTYPLARVTRVDQQTDLGLHVRNSLPDPRSNPLAVAACPPPLPPLQAFRSVFQVQAWRSSCEAAAGGVRGALKTYRCA
jgi:hypothetical protein